MELAVTTLGYVLSKDGQEILMIHRDVDPDDLHYGKYNGLGGKLEEGEDVLSCIIREIAEESGIECTSVELSGTIIWPKFQQSIEDVLCFVFRVLEWKGELTQPRREGTLYWLPVADLLEGKYEVWEGDHLFLPLVLSDHPMFHGVMRYGANGSVSWSFESIK